jgi:hypothetical protein
MKATLNDFGIKFKQVPLLCDNESAVKLTNNLVQHLRTKHIDVRTTTKNLLRDIWEWESKASKHFNRLR